MFNILVGFFSIGYVSAVIITSGNIAATIQNIQAHELLYRFGLTGHILVVLTNIPLAVIFYYLFKIVDRKAALLVVSFTLVGSAVETANLLNQFGPLILLKSGPIQNVFDPAQLRSIVYSLFQLQETGFNVALVFFGCYGISIGYLIIRSTFLPRVIGIFMVIGGLCYLVNSFSSFLVPGFAAGLSPYIQIPSGLAELTFCLWLLMVGLNEVMWKEKAKKERLCKLTYRINPNTHTT